MCWHPPGIERNQPINPLPLRQLKLRRPRFRMAYQGPSSAIMHRASRKMVCSVLQTGITVLRCKCARCQRAQELSISKDLCLSLALAAKQLSDVCDGWRCFYVKPVCCTYTGTATQFLACPARQNEQSLVGCTTKVYPQVHTDASPGNTPHQSPASHLRHIRTWTTATILTAMRSRWSSIVLLSPTSVAEILLRRDPPSRSACKRGGDWCASTAEVQNVRGCSAKRGTNRGICLAACQRFPQDEHAPRQTIRMRSLVACSPCNIERVLLLTHTAARCDMHWIIGRSLCLAWSELASSAIYTYSCE